MNHKDYHDGNKRGLRQMTMIAKIERLNESWQGLFFGSLLRNFTGGLTFALIVIEFYYPAKPVYILPAALLMLCVSLFLEFHSWRWIVKIKRSIRWTLIPDLIMKSMFFVLGLLLAAVTLKNFAPWATSDIPFPSLLPSIGWYFLLFFSETLFWMQELAHEHEERPRRNIIAKIERLNETELGWLLGSVLRALAGGSALFCLSLHFVQGWPLLWSFTAAPFLAVWLILEQSCWRWILTHDGIDVIERRLSIFIQASAMIWASYSVFSILQFLTGFVSYEEADFLTIWWDILAGLMVLFGENLMLGIIFCLPREHAKENNGEDTT